MPLLTDNLSNNDKILFADWIKVRAVVHDLTGKRPDINGMLYLIGMNEFGTVKEFSKEEKQDLMHIGLCTIFKDIFYKFEYKDEEGWLHFEPITDFERIEIREQENLIKEKVIAYFKSNNLIE